MVGHRRSVPWRLQYDVLGRSSKPVVQSSLLVRSVVAKCVIAIAACACSTDDFANESDEDRSSAETWAVFGDPQELEDRIPADVVATLGPGPEGGLDLSSSRLLFQSPAIYAWLLSTRSGADVCLVISEPDVVAGGCGPAAGGLVPLYLSSPDAVTVYIAAREPLSTVDRRALGGDELTPILTIAEHSRAEWDIIASSVDVAEDSEARTIAIRSLELLDGN
jgi:hypothetical protein